MTQSNNTEMESNNKESQNNKVGDADHITEKQSINLPDTNFHETTKKTTQRSHIQKNTETLIMKTVKDKQQSNKNEQNYTKNYQQNHRIRFEMTKKINDVDQQH